LFVVPSFSIEEVSVVLFAIVSGLFSECQQMAYFFIELPNPKEWMSLKCLLLNAGLHNHGQQEHHFFFCLGQFPTSFLLCSANICPSCSLSICQGKLLVQALTSESEPYDIHQRD
jgi:hypothetical protein